MPDEKTSMIQCYNRGCGQLYDPNLNKEDSCTYHSGVPYFHDAYKGWSCCKKKCTDFTEFLNIKGCSKSFHSNVKPAEPEKPPVDKSKVEEVIEYRTPVQQRLERPSFDTPLIYIKCTVTPALAEIAATLKKKSLVDLLSDASMPVAPPSIGTICKNPACKMSYEGPNSDETQCQHHPGVPIFHEGSKFWTCCNKRTFEFDAFLNQKGCTLGKHCWHKEKDDECRVTCRYDWHQTGSHVVVAVYAKRYDPSFSTVRLNPVRLAMEVDLPEEGGVFKLDLELRGIIDVAQSTAAMFGTKLEVSMRKAEPGLWPKLDFPRAPPEVAAAIAAIVPIGPGGDDGQLHEDFDAVDLSDL